MIIQENESLAKYTTFKMGGIAKKIYIPESVEELRELLADDPELARYMISGGSNLLINDRKVYEKVLCLKKFNSQIRAEGNGVFYFGASVRVQEAIRAIHAAGYGGIEYLYSLPALMGGIVYMNAGRGKKYKCSISDWILSVDYLENDEIKSLSGQECGFGFRQSIFQEKDRCVIIGATFGFQPMEAEKAEALVRERIRVAKEKQDMSAPNFGSVFCVSDRRVMRAVQKLCPGKKSGCHFSSKTVNWMLHGEKGSFREAIRLVRRAALFHKLCFRECKTEVRIWE